MAFVDKRADGSERVKYDYDGYFAYIRKGLLSNYQDFAADSHWHDDLELISVLSGGMDYNINGEIINLKAGQGIIVNARQIHYGFSRERNECEFFCILLHPMLLCTTQHIDSELVSPFLSDSSLTYILLDSNIPWQRKILSDIENIYLCKDKPNAPLYIQSSFYNIWIALSENTLRVNKTRRQDRSLSVLKDMLCFIQKSYQNKITLEDISRAGNVSKSTCLSIFKKYLQSAPIEYLIKYRLKQATILLKDGNFSITEIALEVGFGGVSYFTEAFKKHFGCTPTKYN